MSIEEIHKALEVGETVYWNNLSYELRYENCDKPNKYSRLSHKNGKAIMIRHSNSSSGGWLTKEELDNCFVKNTSHD